MILWLQVSPCHDVDAEMPSMGFLGMVCCYVIGLGGIYMGSYLLDNSLQDGLLKCVDGWSGIVYIHT